MLPNSPENKVNKQGRSPLKPERPATEYAVLALLTEGASHGYDLSRRFAENSELSRVCRLEMAMLYSLLRKLEKEGLIVGREEQVSQLKSRRVVEITGQGLKEVESWLSQPVRHAREIRLDFLVKLYFAYRRSPGFALELLDKQYDYMISLLEQLQTQLDSLGGQFEKWVLEFRIEQNKGILNWLENVRKSY